MFLFGKIFTSQYLCYLATFAYQTQRSLCRTNRGSHCWVITWKASFSNAKERKFCIWRATGGAGWSQPVWDTYGWDDTALEPGQARLGAGSQYSRSPGKAFELPPDLPFISRMKYLPRGFSMAPPECVSESEEQEGFVVSEQNHQTTFALLIFFLEVSAWPGRFFSAWKGLKGGEVVGYILTALLTHPRGCCRQILERVSGCRWKSKDFLQDGAGEGSGRGSSHTESCSKDLEGEREINTNIFQEES